MWPGSDPTLCFTFDLDWAPDDILEDLHGLLHEAAIPVTFFCTHATTGTERLLQLPNCEAAIHPNFLSDRQPELVLGELLAQYPSAVGVRNHVLFYHSRLLTLFHSAGLEYLSNDLMFLHAELAPFYDWSGLVRLPIFWEDDVHCIFFEQRFEEEALNLRTPGLKILSFHPVHLYLNSQDMVSYQAGKHALRDPASARAARRANGRGIRTLFLDLLARAGTYKTATLSQVAATFKERNVYQGHYAAFLSRLPQR